MCATGTGAALLPGRLVAPPVVVDLGPDYRVWIDRIHDFFSPPNRTANVSDARRRSANWRCAQALQWAASSPQAGLGYLVRQAIRAGWTCRNRPVLVEALMALRPYRMGPADEPVERLFERVTKEVDRQRQDEDIEDIEDIEDEPLTRMSPRSSLYSAMESGCSPPRATRSEGPQTGRPRPGRPRKGRPVRPAIETVTALAGYLELTTGQRPALIVGGQNDATRQREIDLFRRPDGPQYLVSSRAGGEGINLQVARRLVHLDIPWNPDGHGAARRAGPPLRLAADDPRRHLGRQGQPRGRRLRCSPEEAPADHGHPRRTGEVRVPLLAGPCA